MKRCLNLIVIALFVGALALSCGKENGSTTPITGGTGTNNTGGGQNNGPVFELPEPNADAVNYADLHDPIKDVGQFYLPKSNMKPEVFWRVVYGNYGTRQEPGQNDINLGLENSLLMKSIIGLVNRACEEGKTNIAIWEDCGGTGYQMEYDALTATGAKEIGKQTAFELATKTYGDWNGHKVTVKDLFDGYVLTDVVGNPESANVAAVASHVFNSIIVDVNYEQRFKDFGYKMTYDCRNKTLKDAFNEFKDKCNNECLVVMPVKCSELRDFVIKNNLFIVNLNKKWADSSAGQNGDLFDEVLDWLKPNSQVLGWEQGVGEDVFVNRVSRHGHLMLAADWSYNHTLTSRAYQDRQPSDLVKTINPRSIDYGKNKRKYFSFFLTDGDNYQYIITDNFEKNYYTLPSAISTKTAFEIGTQSLIQLAPTRFSYIVQKQPSAHCTIMDTFGGGYYYIDTYSTTGTGAAHRKENLKVIAERTAAHMRQHGIKVLHVMAMNLHSDAAKEALQAFVDANDQLEGITAVQYSPYTGGGGDIIWVKNNAGYDIPCITCKYMIWQGITTPKSVAADMIAKETANPSFSTVCLHAWSSFDGRQSTDMAALCLKELNTDFAAVSMQELIWRVRMHYKEEQTLKYLATIK